MSAIAFNIQGEPFEVPPQVVAFRAKRLKPRGAPEVFYGVDGLPLVVPVDAGIDEVRNLIGDITDGETLRLRLDPIDEEGRIVEKVSPAYVQVTPRRTAASVDTAARPACGSDGVSAVVLEAMRTNATLAQTVIEKLPAIMDAAAKVLAAADGAGMPARTPPVHVEATSDAPAEDEAVSKPDNRPRNATAEMLQSISAVMDSARPYAKIAATMFGGRNGARNGVATAFEDEVPREPRVPAAKPTTAKAAASATPDPVQVMRHMNEVQARLTDDERAVARTAAAEMSPDEVQHWIATLGDMSVEQAVDEVRRLIAGTKTGGVS